MSEISRSFSGWAPSPFIADRQSGMPCSGLPAMMMLRSPWSLMRARYSGSTIGPGFFLSAFPEPSSPWHRAQDATKVFCPWVASPGVLAA